MVIPKYATKLTNCPAFGICTINRIELNSTLIRDNLYPDNHSMNQFFSRRILFCNDAC